MANQISFERNGEKYFVEQGHDYLTIHTYYGGEKLSSEIMEADKVEWIKRVLGRGTNDEISLSAIQYARGWVGSAVDYIERQKTHLRFINYDKSKKY